MAYVGQGIKGGTFSVLDTSGNTYNGSNVTFNLGTQVGSPAQLLVSHDGVIQKPVTDYTIATGGTQITFTTAPASGASIFITEISGAVGAPMNRDINGDELILDADGDTSITADTDDQIDIRVAGTDQITIKDGALSPVTDSDIDLGTSSLEFKDAYFDGTVTSDAGLFDTLGVITTKDLGIGIHIRTADSGGSVSTDADELVLENSAGAGITMLGGTGNDLCINFGDSGGNARGRIIYGNNGDQMYFHTAAAERLRINDDGNVCVNTAGLGTQGIFQVQGKTSNNIAKFQTGTDDEGIVFNNASGSLVGSVQVGASATAFNTSSDYRLKENVDYDFDATTRLKQLKPARFNWIIDDTNTLLDGFLAHEVSSIVPEAITGTKDKVDSEGNPVHQGIDQSKLVPLLVKTIQELEARIKTLEDA